MLDLMLYPNVNDDSLFTIAARSPHLLTLRLTHNQHVTHSGLVHLAAQCRALDTVSLRGCWWVNSSCVAAFLISCPVLRELDVADMVQITDIATDCMGVSWIFSYHLCKQKVDN